MNCAHETNVTWYKFANDKEFCKGNSKKRIYKEFLFSYSLNVSVAYQPHVLAPTYIRSKMMNSSVDWSLDCWTAYTDDFISLLKVCIELTRHFRRSDKEEMMYSVPWCLWSTFLKFYCYGIYRLRNKRKARGQYI